MLGGSVLRTFSRDGLIFDVREEGPVAGAPVVLLHGFPETSASWRDVMLKLAAAGYHVLAPDQRGYSPRARPASRRAYRRPELVADVLALADQMDVDRFHLVGHDWGAAVAWGVAMEHPHRLRSLTSLSIPHPAAFRRAAFTSRQALRSWYMAFFQLPARRGVSARCRVAAFPPRFALRWPRRHAPDHGAAPAAVGLQREGEEWARLGPLAGGTGVLRLGRRARRGDRRRELRSPSVGLRSVERFPVAGRRYREVRLLPRV